MIAEARAFNPDLRAYAFINRADATGTENIEAAEYIQDTNELEFINTPLGYRKVFGKAASKGLSVIEHKPTDPKAIAEVTALSSLRSLRLRLYGAAAIAASDAPQGHLPQSLASQDAGATRRSRLQAMLVRLRVIICLLP